MEGRVGERGRWATEGRGRGRAREGIDLSMSCPAQPSRGVDSNGQRDPDRKKNNKQKWRHIDVLIFNNLSKFPSILFKNIFFFTSNNLRSGIVLFFF